MEGTEDHSEESDNNDNADNNLESNNLETETGTEDTGKFFLFLIHIMRKDRLFHIYLML